LPEPREADLRLLGDGNPGVAREAQERLVAAGAAAIPLLQVGFGSDNRERRERALAAFWRIRGSEPRGDVELTALAVLAFLSAGHTHQSRGCFGAAVREGLRWLAARTAFDAEDRRAKGVAAAAIIGVHRRTSSVVLEGPVERARAWIKEWGVWDDVAYLWTTGWIDPAERRPVPGADFVEACGAVLTSRWRGDGPSVGACSRMMRLAKGEKEEVQRCGKMFKEDPPPSYLGMAKEGIRSDQLGAGCVRGSWKDADPRRRLEKAALAVMILGLKP
jgi:hypothetical protein